MPSTLDALFAECAESDWRVCNLYQSPNTGLWRVNLYHSVEGGAEYGDWGEGDTLHEALTAAIGNMAHREFTADIAPTGSINTTSAPSLTELMKLVAKPRQPIERRL